MCYGPFVMNSELAPMADEQGKKRTRGHGKGSNFFALGRDVWERVWTAETTNRLNFTLTYLVLLAGTGSDHRLTKWSAKACEQYLGIGKPRAKHAIDELMAAGLVKLTEKATRLMPQYELPELPLEADPIFLPMQLVTGLGDETPVLRRIRETGDALLLRMLIDLYGMLVLDATYGIPIENLRQGGFDGDQPSARRIASVGAHAIWAIKGGTWRGASGDWASRHYVEGKKGAKGNWSLFWERVDLLKQIGALYYEPWLFDSDALDAEPLMPLDPAGLYAVADPDDEAKLTRLAFDAVHALVSEVRPHFMDSHGDTDFVVPLTLHQQTPALRHVARLRIEADTPGRRLAWKRRRILIDQRGRAYRQLIEDASKGQFDRPMRFGAEKSEAEWSS